MTWGGQFKVTEVTLDDEDEITAQCVDVTSNTEGRVVAATVILVLDSTDGNTKVRVGDVFYVGGHFDGR